jgi:hypothetical protein
MDNAKKKRTRKKKFKNSDQSEQEQMKTQTTVVVNLNKNPVWPTAHSATPLTAEDIKLGTIEYNDEMSELTDKEKRDTEKTNSLFGSLYYDISKATELNITDTVKACLLSDYTVPALQAKLNLIPYGPGPIKLDCLQLSKILMDLGSVVEKMEMFTNSQITRHLNNIRQTLICALHIISTGYRVHIIEGVNADGVRMFSSVDMVASVNSRVIAIDITRVKTQEKLFQLYHAGEALIGEKIMVLQSVFQDANVLPAVMGIKYEDTEYELTLPNTKSFLLEKDFEFAEKIMKAAQKLTISEVREIATAMAKERKAPEINHFKNTAKMRKHVFVNAERIKRSISNNDPESAEYFEEFSRIASPEARKCYSLDIMTNLTKIDINYNVESSADPDSGPFLSHQLLKKRNEPLRDKLDFEHFCKSLHEQGCKSWFVWAFSLFAREDDRKELEGSASESVLNSVKYHPQPDEKNLCPWQQEMMLHEGIEIHPVFKTNQETKVREKQQGYVIHFTAKSQFKSLADYIEKVHPKTPKKHMTYSDMEKEWLNVEDYLSTPHVSGFATKVVDKLIDLVPETCEIEQFTKKTLKTCLARVSQNRMCGHVEDVADVALAVNSSKKRNKRVKKKGNMFKRCVTVLPSIILGKMGIVLATREGTTKQKEFSYMVAGLFEDYNVPDYSTYPMRNDQSKWLNMSKAQLNWQVGLFAKFLSLWTQRFDTMRVNRGYKNITHHFKKDMFSAVMMLMNDSKFSQINESVRFLFINTTGRNTNQKGLWDKNRWYRPSKWVQTLYVLRMLKMSTFLDLLKKNKMITLALEKLSNNHGAAETKEWMVAMPQEGEAQLSLQAIYNSFYVCREMQIERDNTLSSQARVVLKDIEMIELYNKTRKDRDEMWNELLKQQDDDLEIYKDDIKGYFMKHVLMKPCVQYDPCYVTVAFGAAASMASVHSSEDDETTIGQLSKFYDKTSTLGKIKMEEVMNTRASCTLGNEIGLGNYEEVLIDKVNPKTKQKETTVVVKTQNSLCYKSMMCLMKHVKDNKVKTVNDISVYMNDQAEKLLDKLDPLPTAEEFLKYPSNALPYLLHVLGESHPMIRRMVHKDQIGDREISVMNAAMRLVAYTIDTWAREVQKVEHSAKDFTNLIEYPDKDDVAKKMFDDSLEIRARESESRFVIYDNADCKKWGPAHMMTVFLICLGMRNNDSSFQSILRLMLTMFSNKVFKIPDKIYQYIVYGPKKNRKTELVFDKCAEKLRESPINVANLSKQILMSTAGMGQGLLGCSSSVVGTDSLRLSNMILMELYKDLDFTITALCTSDDYVRVFTFLKRNQDTTIESESANKVIHDTVAWVMFVGRAFSIERNEHKSTISTVIMELNSIFQSAGSRNTPDVKSRLSYVDFGQHTDPHENYVRCIRQGESYLRTEMSVTGATWITILNMYLGLIQNQNLSLFLELGSDLQYVPLELGGIPEIDINKSLQMHKMTCFMKNYSLAGKEKDYELTFDIMRDVTNEYVEDVSDLKDMEVGFGRSGTRSDINPGRKVSSMRETMMTWPHSVFKSLMYKSKHRNLLTCMISNTQRDMSEGGASQPKDRHYRSTVPTKLKIFRVTSNLLKSIIGSTKASREDLLKGAKKWLEMRKNYVVTSDEIRFSNPVFSITRTMKKEQLAVVKQCEQDYYLSINSIRNIREVIPMQRYPVKAKFRQVYLDKEFVAKRMEEFDLANKPVVLGGASTVHPFVYISARMTQLTRLENWQYRKQTMYITLLKDMPKGTRLEIILFKTSFVENGALVFDYSEVDGTRDNSLTAIELAHGAIHRQVPAYVQKMIKHHYDICKYDFVKSEQLKNTIIKNPIDIGFQPTKMDKKRAKKNEILKKTTRSYEDFKEFNYKNLNLGRLTMSEFDDFENCRFDRLDVTDLVNAVSAPKTQFNVSDYRTCVSLISVFASVCSKIKGINNTKNYENSQDFIYRPSSFVFRPDGIRESSSPLQSTKRFTTDVTTRSIKTGTGDMQVYECTLASEKGVWKHYITDFDEERVKPSDIINKDVYSRVFCPGPLVNCTFVNIKGTIFLSYPKIKTSINQSTKKVTHQLINHLLMPLCVDTLSNTTNFKITGGKIDTKGSLIDSLSWSHIKEMSYSIVPNFSKYIDRTKPTIIDEMAGLNEVKTLSEIIEEGGIFFDDNDKPATLKQERTVEVLPPMSMSQMEDYAIQRALNESNQKEGKTEVDESVGDDMGLLADFDEMMSCFNLEEEENLENNEKTSNNTSDESLPDDTETVYSEREYSNSFSEEEEEETILTQTSEIVSLDKKLLMLAAKNPMIITNTYKKEEVKTKKGKTIKQRYKIRSINFRIPGLDVGSDVVLVMRKRHPSLLATFLDWFYTQKITNETRRWVFTYICTLIESIPAKYKEKSLMIPVNPVNGEEAPSIQGYFYTGLIGDDPENPWV